MPWEATRRALAGELGATDGALPGSVVLRQMRCGKPGCACKHDPPTLHGPYIQWTRTVDDETVTRYLIQDQLARYQGCFDNARRLKEIVAKLEIVSLHAVEQSEAARAPTAGPSTPRVAERIEGWEAQPPPTGRRPRSSTRPSPPGTQVLLATR